MSKKDVLEDSPFNKVQFMVRIEVLEQEVRGLRQANEQKEKQVKAMAAMHRRLSKQFAEISRVDPKNADYFLGMFRTFCGKYFEEGGFAEAWTKVEGQKGFRSGVRQALRQYGAKLMEGKVEQETP